MSRVLGDSRVSWLGKIPDSWSTCRVKNKFLFHKIIAKEKSVNYDRIALTLNGVIKRDKDDSNGLQPDNYNGYQVVYKDDLIFKLIDLENVNTSRIGKSEYEGITSPAYLVLTDKCNTRYSLYYFLNMWYQEIFNNIGGDGVRSAINKDDLLRVPFIDISIGEQNKIAKYLDNQCVKIDEIISDNNREIELLDEYKDKIIYDYFKEIKEEIKLKYIISSNTRTLSEKGNEEKEIMYIDIGSVNSDGEITNTEKYMFKNAPSRARRIVKTNDVIISTVRTYLKAIALINSVYDDYICSTGFSVLKPSNMIDSKYLFYALKNICFTDKVSANSTGISYPAITDSKLINLKIKITDFNNQKLIANKIDKKINKINEIVEYRKQIIEKLEEYKRSLIYEYVTGKREV